MRIVRPATGEYTIAVIVALPLEIIGEPVRVIVAPEDVPAPWVNFNACDPLNPGSASPTTLAAADSKAVIEYCEESSKLMTVPVACAGMIETAPIVAATAKQVVRRINGFLKADP